VGTLFFALSLAMSLYLQAARSFGSDAASAAVAIAALLFFAALWWVLPRRLVRRVQQARQARAR
jgi:hypothetical protein